MKKKEKKWKKKRKKGEKKKRKKRSKKKKDIPKISSKREYNKDSLMRKKIERRYMIQWKMTLVGYNIWFMIIA